MSLVTYLDELDLLVPAEESQEELAGSFVCRTFICKM